MSAPVPTSIGRYQIIRSLGEGGMGAVFLARDPAIDRHVAIKLMRTGFDDPSLRERFAREAKSIGRLHHPNIVTIFDVGEHQGEPFIAMEYVEGQTLSHLIRHPENVSVLDKIGWIDGVCSGLNYAHRAGIIHRDIKPANIMVDAEGEVKILDFGIARATSSGSTHAATQAGTVLGTLNYMSPEQLAGKAVDSRTDIFSAGAVFYELLSGRMAFPGDIQTGVLHLILASGPEPLSTVAPFLDADLVAIVDRCLARDVALRYSDLASARRDLTSLRRKLESGPSQGETVVIAPRAGVPESRPGRTPGPDTRAELLRLRKERIAEQLSGARAALEREEFTAALDACRQALIIDPEHDEALALQEEVESAAETRAWLKQAQGDLDRGALTSAGMLADRVLGVRPSSPEALGIRRAVEEARRRLEEIERQARALQTALSQARAHITDGRLDQAALAANEALAIDPDNPDVVALQSEVASLIEAKRRADAEARAQQVVSRARERFATGDYEGALTMLRAYQPSHETIRAAIVSFELEMREIARRAEEQRKAEAKRREQEARERAEAERREAEARKRAEEEERRKAKAAEQAAEEERRRAEAHRREEVRRRAEAEQAREEQVRREAAARQKAEADEQRRLADARSKAEAVEEARRREREEDERRAAALPTIIDAPVVDAGERRPAVPGADDTEMLMRRSDGSVAARAGETIIFPFPALGPERERAEPPATFPAGRPPWVVGLALGAVALVLVALVWSWAAHREAIPSTSSGPTAAVTTVAVLFDIRPWANVDEIVRKSDNKPLALGKLTTPCVVSLEPGEYHVRARNPYFPSAPLEFDVTVSSGPLQEVRRSLPGLKPEDEARRILEGR